MNLEIKNVSKTLPEYRQVIDLVKNSFPKEEQYPIWLLKLWALKKMCIFGLTIKMMSFVVFLILSVMKR